MPLPLSTFGATPAIVALVTVALAGIALIGAALGLLSYKLAELTLAKRGSGNALSARSRLVAAVVMAAALTLLAVRWGASAQLVAYGGLACLLMAAALADLSSLTIPNELVLAACVWWLATVWAMPNPAAAATNGAVGALCVGGGLWAFSALYSAIAKRPSLGGGDVKLLFAVALYLGLEGSLLNLLLSCTLGILFAAARSLARAARGKSGPGSPGNTLTEGIAFGPAIALSTTALLVIGA